VATLATIGDSGVHVGEKPARRRETTAAGDVVAGHALIQRRDVIRLFADGSNRNEIGIAAMAAFTIARDIRVPEIRHLPERRTGRVTHAAVLADRQMGSGFAIERVAGGVEVAVMAQRTIVRIDVQVIERRAGKIRRVVAVGTILNRTQRRRKMAR